MAPFLLRGKLGLLEYVNADTIALRLSAFDPEKVAFEAGRIMVERLRELAGQRASFAFESTLATRSYAPWIRWLRVQGYAFHLLFLWLHSPELAVQRVRERVRAGGHDVPEPVIRRRYQRGIRNFFGLYQALADSWAVYDNSFGNPELIARGGGQLAATIYRPDLWYNFSEAAK